ncbi:MAG: hypothetical protein AUI14_14300 [Actinobacteria bacterium 13_2_20CM_2_71_6]|nr:MAG: hypothetical protein AUI14_14300 [Actinobacteria bacterium 13_2_20CM_2_71_6]
MVAAVVVPLTEPGLGWPLGGAATIAAVLACGPRGHRELSRILAASGVVLLLAAGTLRAAGWLFVLCLAAAVPLASLAVAGGGRTWRRTVRGAVALPAAAFGPTPYDFRGVRLPGRDGIGRLWRGGLVGLALLLVFGALFASADPVFADLVGRAVPRLSPGSFASGAVLFAIAAVSTLVAVHLRTAPPRVDERADRIPLRRYDWAVPVALLDALFAVFVGVQVTVLFGGHGYVLGPGGPTYAVYARNGFWQLSAATVLTLGIVAFVAHRAGREAPVERRLIRLLVGPLCLLAIVVVASALRRMELYVEAYGFTRVRLGASAVELTVGIAFLLVLAAGVRLRGTWLPGAAVAIVAATLVTLVVVNPDAYIARTIIARFQHDGHLDAGYLSGLSADAIPAIARLPEPYRSCVLAGMADRPSTVDRWYAFNAGRRTARAILAARPVPKDAQPCPYVIRGPRDG